MSQGCGQQYLAGKRQEEIQRVCLWFHFVFIGISLKKIFVAQRVPPISSTRKLSERAWPWEFKWMVPSIPHLFSETSLSTSDLDKREVAVRFRSFTGNRNPPFSWTWNHRGDASQRRGEPLDPECAFYFRHAIDQWFRWTQVLPKKFMLCNEKDFNSSRVVCRFVGLRSETSKVRLRSRSMMQKQETRFHCWSFWSSYWDSSIYSFVSHWIMNWKMPF